jgi:hypothetical protein
MDLVSRFRMRGAVSVLFHTTYDMVLGEVQKQLLHVIGKIVYATPWLYLQTAATCKHHRSEYCPHYRRRCGNEMFFTCFTRKIDE